MCIRDSLCRLVRAFPRLVLNRLLYSATTLQWLQFLRQVVAYDGAVVFLYMDLLGVLLLFLIARSLAALKTL